MLNQTRLQEILNYDYKTGIFTYRVGRNNQIAIDTVAGSKMDIGYIRIVIDGKAYMAHRLVWLYLHGSLPELYIDHINGIRDDNRVSNLREVSRTTNNQNRTCLNRNNSSGKMGVDFLKRSNKFRARLRVDGKEMHLGLFATESEAVEVWLCAKKQYHQGFIHG